MNNHFYIVEHYTAERLNVDPFYLLTQRLMYFKLSLLVFDPQEKGSQDSRLKQMEIC